MKRRKLLSLLPLLALSPIPTFSNFFGYKSENFILQVLCTPIRGNRTYQSQEEFWNDFQDQVSCKLNDEFLQTGKLIKLSTSLSDNGKSIILTKIYRTRKDYQDYMSRWESHFPNGITDEELTLKYKILNKSHFALYGERVTS